MQTIVNLGTGGADLNGQNGSTSSADSNDALFLDWPGDNAGNYVYLPGVAGNSLSVPDEAALDITGDIDLRVQVALDDWTPGAPMVFVSKWYTEDSFIFRVETSGLLRLYWSPDGATSLFSTSTVAPTVSNGSALWVRATLDVDNGASGRDVKFYTSNDGIAWTQLGSTITSAGVTSIFSSVVNVEVGSYGNKVSAITAGKFYRAQILNGINGTPVLDVDCSQITSGADTSFTALTGQTVTINRSTAGRKSVAVVSPVWLFGTDDYIEVAANALLGADASQDFTVVIVHRIWDTPVSSGAKISTTVPGAAAGRIGFHLRQLTTTYQSQNYWQDESVAKSEVLDASLAPSAGELSVMGIIIDRTNTNWMYSFSSAGIDPVATDISSVGSTVSPNVLRIARTSQGGSQYSDMEVVAVAIFRRALSATEIAQLTTYYQNKVA